MNSFKAYMDARRRGEKVGGNGPHQRPIDQMSEQELEQEIYDLKRDAVRAGREMVANTRGPTSSASRPVFTPKRGKRRQWK